MDNNTSIEIALLLTFEAGRWLGQVDLEENYDREQYGFAMLESLQAKRTAMPADKASSGSSVNIRLRSDKWRNGVRHSAQEQMNKARSILKTIIDKYEK